MYEKTISRVRNLPVLALLLTAGTCMANADVTQVVDNTIRPLMQQQAIPGMSVAVIQQGRAQYFNYGVASKQGPQAVTENTLFEIGSISKTFTATLAAYAQSTGKLKLSDMASDYLPALRGSAFDGISLLQLGTYTPGGLPLQFPEHADSADKMIGYFQQWKPDYAPGAQRVYSNPSLGLFGFLAAKSLGQPFDQAMEQTLLPKLGLTHTYINVPKEQMALYAQGYAKDDQPVRVGPGALDAEAYGIKSSASDMAHYLEVNMRAASLAPALKNAIATTHTGYYTVGGTTQGLGWEFYPYPVKLDTLIEGNSTPMAMQPNKANWLAGTQSPAHKALFNKTGSTRGFGAYVAYVPSKHIGVVILANKNYPNAERVKAAHAILSALDQ